MSEYNGLRDYNLSGFFCSKEKKNHLIKMGMITKKGYIIQKPEEYLRKKELYKKIYEEETLTKTKKKKNKTIKKKKNPYKENLP